MRIIIPHIDRVDTLNTKNTINGTQLLHTISPQTPLCRGQYEVLVYIAAINILQRITFDDDSRGTPRVKYYHSCEETDSS